MQEVENNIKKLKKEIDSLQSQSKKNDLVTLIAVTKTVGADKVNEAIRSGIKDVGENKVQEIINKYPLAEKKINWHLIGSLQTNKVKYIIDKASLIHSLDRIELAAEIDKRAKSKSITVNCLVQVNISREESKHGVLIEDAVEFIETVAFNYKNIKILGLMGMASFEEDSENTRPYFRKLKDLYDTVNLLKIDNVQMKHLSMGMSNDYKVAVQEGSNMVRIGTAIFGERNYD